MEIVRQIASTLSYVEEKAAYEDSKTITIHPENAATIVGISWEVMHEHLKILNILGKIKLNGLVVEVLQ